MSNGSIYGSQVPAVDPTPEQVLQSARDEYDATVSKALDVMQADIADAQRRQLEAIQHARRVYRLRLGLD